MIFNKSQDHNFIKLLIIYCAQVINVFTQVNPCAKIQPHIQHIEFGIFRHQNINANKKNMLL